MSARYLLRFDDLNPAMNWSVWDEVERLLDDAGVAPLLAVVPDNRDPALRGGEERADFWDRVRAWQGRGWAIGLHGHQHVYTTAEQGLVGRRPKSEFAGLPEAEQRAKLAAGLGLFEEQGVRADAWVAPGHTFDSTTLHVLAELGTRVVSDGLGVWPYSDPRGLLWVPQQLWWFRQRPFGVWTVCLHHNSWQLSQLEMFRKALNTYRGRMTDLASIAAEYAERPRSRYDALGEAAVRIGLDARDRFARWLR